MKKFISLLLILILVLCFAACGGNETPDENSDNNIVDNVDDNQNADNVTSNKEITLEDVENAPVSSESYFEVVEVEGGVSIDEYTGNDEIVVIPDSIGGKTVISLGEGVFAYNDFIKAIKLSDNIETICEESCMGMEKLEIFVAGSNLKKIEKYAISCCDLLSIVNLNENLETIELGGISSNSNLKELFVPSSVINPEGILMSPNTKIICNDGSKVIEHAEHFGFAYEIR